MTMKSSDSVGRTRHERPQSLGFETGVAAQMSEYQTKNFM